MKIPRNLPVGTVFILRNGDKRTIGGRGIVRGGDPRRCFYNMVEYVAPMTYYPRDNGAHASGDRNWDIIRIERIAIAKPNRRLAAAKVDKDVAWLLRLAEAYAEQYRELEQCTPVPRRLRAIARRLEVE